MDFDNEFLFSDFEPLDPDDQLETTDNLTAPIRHDRKTAKRQFVNGLKKQALTELVRELPPPDTDVYILSNGSGSTYRVGGDPLAFEFGHFIPVLVDMLGGNGCTLYVSTWTMNRQHALNILDMVDTGKIARLAVMTDPYFLQRESAVANQLVTGIKQRKQRFLAFKNHVKALAIANADNTQFTVVTGSANLSSQPRAENFILSTDPGLYWFLVSEFFEVMLNHG